MKTKEDLIKAGPSIGVGLLAGIGLGIAFNNIGLGIAFGLIFGSAYSQTIGKK
ncbi:hypothetical protein COB87_000970 [Candidatus Wolfebacteria bacterium]|nr:hypothetical protein [Candidatus Wolfebacteria bacterium]